MIFVNGTKLYFKPYPNGETVIPELRKLLTGKGHDWTFPLVRMNYETDLDLFHLILVSKYIDDLGWGTAKGLTLPYLPYSRMDRTENDSAFTLRHIADIINGLGYREVLIGEPHSDVSPALIRNSRTVWLTPELVKIAMEQTLFDPLQDHLYFPDAGAEKRYSKMFPGIRYIVGSKKRDFTTGKILSIEIGQVQEPSRNVIMIDDLCAYGGTFIGGAWALDEAGIDGGCLVVAHCENSIFSGKLLDDPFFSFVFTTDSMVHEKTHDKINAIKARI